MKTIRKFWGVALIVVLLATLFVGGTVQKASGSTLMWSYMAMPDATGVTYQVAPGVEPANLVVAPDGTLFALDANSDDGVVYKSTTGGLTWTKSVAVTGVPFVDLAVSPSYKTDKTVFALDEGPNAQVYISVNGGATFGQLGGTVAGTGYSIAVSPTYAAGAGEVMVGTTTNAYIWNKDGIQNWIAQGVPEALKVAYSPNYVIDLTRVIVSANATGTYLHTLVADDAVDTTVYAVTSGTPTLVTTNVKTSNDIYGYSIAFPSDFNAASVYTRTCYVGTDSDSALDDIISVYVSGGPTASAPMYGFTDKAVASLAYSGTTVTGTLFAGMADAAMVEMISSGSVTSTSTHWGYNIKGPTGEGYTCVALATDFATSNKVYASTTGDEGAVSLSTDGGLYFNQIGLINTYLSSIDDLQAVSSSVYYMSTHNTHMGGTTSIWKTTNGGLAWYRYSMIASEDSAIIRLSPNYATDKTVVVGLVGATAPYNIYITNDEGNSWTPRSTTPNGTFEVGDIAVKDQYTIYVGNANVATGALVQSTANGGWTWQTNPTPVASGAFTVTSLKLDVTSGALLAGLSGAAAGGSVYISYDNNTTWVGEYLFGVSNASVAFDANYGTNGIIYAAGATSNVTNGVFRFGGFATYANGWLNMIGDEDDVANGPNKIMTTPDGSLYGLTAGGVLRSINPTAGGPAGAALDASGVEWNYIPKATFTAMTWAAGSNILYTTDGVFGYTYTDTLAPSNPAAVPVPTAPINGAVFNQTNQVANDKVTFKWNAVTGATRYMILYDTRPDFATANADFVYAPVTSLTEDVTGGATYYWMVRVYEPLIGPWCAPQNFQTELVVTELNAPDLIGATGAGSTLGGGYDVSVTPTFSWGPVNGATGYEFQLSKSADISNPTIDDTGANALTVTALTLTSPLNYNTTYYWKVRAISAGSYTDWTAVQAFTTMDVPPVSAPPVIITTQPQVTLSIPPATTTQVVITQAATKEINPNYIWAIIIIGAVLVLAVIVLIVRTRRAV